MWEWKIQGDEEKLSRRRLEIARVKCQDEEKARPFTLSPRLYLQLRLICILEHPVNLLFLYDQQSKLFNYQRQPRNNNHAQASSWICFWMDLLSQAILLTIV